MTIGSTFSCRYVNDNQLKRHACASIFLDLLLSQTLFYIVQIEAYPKTTAVLVRNHGIYVWGDSWISAKTQVSHIESLFYIAFIPHLLCANIALLCIRTLLKENLLHSAMLVSMGIALCRF